VATNLIKITEQAALVWADADDYANTVSGLVLTAQIDLTSLSAGAARQGVKVDIGNIRYPEYMVSVGIEIASAAASGETIDFYWAGSPKGIAGNANPGGTDGTDDAYTGTAGDSLADSLKQLQYIGSLVTTADNTTVVQYGTVGSLNGSDINRFGMPVVVNNSSGALVADAVEQYVALIPIPPDIQAAT